MKTPISYYGGKQSMLDVILPMIPEHKAYVEPFFGGGAVFFGKARSKFEAINDLNRMVVNFYEHCQNEKLFELLKIEINKSFMSRNAYEKSKLILANSQLFTNLELAWAFWYGVNFSFNNTLDGGYRHKTDRKEVNKLVNKVASFDERIYHRMKDVEIENIDALALLERRDKEQTFFYIDPPYAGANQGHYRGYTDKNFMELLEILGGIKGKFLLSCFDTKYLDDFIKKNNWNIQRIVKTSTASTNKKTKTELLIYNYDNNEVKNEDNCLQFKKQFANADFPLHRG